MIKVIKIDKRKALLVFLVLVGAAFCLAGFEGLAQKFILDKFNKPTSVTTTQSGEEAGSLGGGVPVQNDGAALQAAEVFGAEDMESAAFFVEYRMERERTRSKEVELLREVLVSPSTGEETRKKVQEKLLEISSNMSKEMELENLIRARGYRDAAVFLDGDTVTVVVQPGKNILPGTEENSEIAALVSKSAGVPEDNVIIITKDFPS